MESTVAVEITAVSPNALLIFVSEHVASLHQCEDSKNGETRGYGRMIDA